jgi:hypothetical protein
MKVIGQAHALVHQQGAQRIQTSMRVGTRYGAFQLAWDLYHQGVGVVTLADESGV